jgi:methylmalonyl-CoA mutase N-terminal domain/subunit
MERTSESGFPIDPVYDASKLTDFQPEAKLGRPGEYPFTRGAYPLAAVPGGPQPLPGTKAARLAVRPQPVVEAMTDEDESAARRVAGEIDEGNLIVVGVNKCVTDGEGTGNVLYPLRDARRADVTLGERCDALRVFWGEYHPSEM